MGTVWDDQWDLGGMNSGIWEQWAVGSESNSWWELRRMSSGNWEG